MQEKLKSKRMPEMDILRGITIILVVVGHTKVPGNSFIYLFHMAVFFIVSGYFYPDKSSESLKSICQFVKKKILSLWIPFSVGISMFTILNNLFVRIGVLTNNTKIYDYVSQPYASIHPLLSWIDALKNILKTFVFSGSAQMAGTFWFFKTLFLVSLLYCCVDFCLRRFGKFAKINIGSQWMQIVVSIILLALGNILAKHNKALGGMTRVFLVYCLYCGGHLFRKMKRIKLNVAVIMAVGGVVILCLCNKVGTIALDKLEIFNPLFYLCCSFAGMAFIYGISRFIDAYLNKIGGGLSYIGKHSMAIMIGHFLSFKLVSYGLIAIRKIPYFCAAAFPVLTDIGFYWIPYTIVGIALPLIVQMIWRKLTIAIRRKLLDDSIY